MSRKASDSPSAVIDIKARRASAPKSRNGCLTCKNRRIKCDETRPRCTSCTKSCRTCQWKRSPSASQRTIIPQNAFHFTQLSEALKFIDSREVYYFWAFQHETARELSGLRKSSAWTHALLQSCHTDPFVLRGLVAIGALDKFIKKSRAASLNPRLRCAHQTRANQHREFALTAYDKAIAGMRRLDPNSDQNTFLRKALIGCLLVNCIESYLQDPNTAYLQAQVGHDLLHRWITESANTGTGLGSPNTSVIEDEIFSEFTRQDLFTGMRLMTVADFKVARNPRDPMHRNGTTWRIDKQLERHQLRRREGTLAIQNMPSSFSSLEEARKYQDLILRRIFHLVGETFTRIISAKAESGHTMTADTPGELVDPCHIPTNLLGDRDTYIQDIRRWCRAYEPVFNGMIPSSDLSTPIDAALLRIHALEAEISLAATFYTSECSFDTHLPSFREIVSLSQFIVHQTPQNPAPVFNLDIGIEKGLYSTTTYCRDKTIRHSALRILQSQAYRDATNNICRMVARAYFIIELEEAGRRADGFIPEDARWRRIWLLNHYFEESQNLTVVCARRIGYPAGKVYPAAREWRLRTWTQDEVESIATSKEFWIPAGLAELEPWPKTLRKPGCVKWAEVHDELLRTVDVR